MSYGPHTRNPYEDDFAYERDEAADAEAEHVSPCACGDDRCRIDDRDETNVNVNGKWFSADCVGLCMACHEVDDLHQLYKAGGGRLIHAQPCPDHMERVRR